jgi:hypothetical protein
MADITMCSGKDCPKKHTCHRYLAKADRYQSFFVNPPIKESGECEHYWDEPEMNERCAKAVKKYKKSLKKTKKPKKANKNNKKTAKTVKKYHSKSEMKRKMVMEEGKLPTQADYDAFDATLEPPCDCNCENHCCNEDVPSSDPFNTADCYGDYPPSNTFESPITSTDERTPFQKFIDFLFRRN